MLTIIIIVAIIFIGCELSTICHHHLHLYHLNYAASQKSKACIDPFQRRKKVVRKNLRMLAESEVGIINKRCNVSVVLGQKICDNCRIGLKNEFDMNEFDHISDLEIDSDPDAFEMTSYEQSLVANAINDRLCSQVGASPLKAQKVFNENASYIEEKAMKIYHHVREKLYELAGVPCPEMAHRSMVHLHDYSDILTELKSAIPKFQTELKLQALTLLSDKVALKKLSELFEISTHLCKQARVVKKELGSLALRRQSKKPSRKVTTETQEKVLAFYENDEW